MESSFPECDRVLLFGLTLNDDIDVNCCILGNYLANAARRMTALGR